MASSPEHYQNVDKAFSRQAPGFDTEEKDNPIIQIMRSQVRAEAMKLLPVNANILELNAGTGLDTVWFARQGFKVLATDISSGMINQTKQKVIQHGLQNQVHVEQASFLELKDKISGTFDFVFSNFGGLNCEGNLQQVLHQLITLTHPGSHALLVIMPPICPWEILTLIKGNWKHAFRRLKKGGAMANLEGVSFQTYYYSRTRIKKILPPEWKLKKTIGLGALLPQPHSLKFPKEHPLIFNLLKKLDNYVRNFAPFNQWADHIMVVLERA